MADAADLKSAAREGVRVRVPAPAPRPGATERATGWAYSAREIGSDALLPPEACPATMTEPPGAAHAGEGVVERVVSIVDRINIEADLDVARQRAWTLTPFCPAWDAAMAIVEDLERALWRASTTQCEKQISEWTKPDERHSTPSRAGAKVSATQPEQAAGLLLLDSDRSRPRAVFTERSAREPHQTIRGRRSGRADDDRDPLVDRLEVEERVVR